MASMDATKAFRTPGQLIEALLEERGWSNRVLAAVLEVEETGVSKLIAAKKAVTPETAIALEEVFGVPAERFLALQRDLDLAKARIVAIPDPSQARRAQLFADLPLAKNSSTESRRPMRPRFRMRHGRRSRHLTRRYLRSLLGFIASSALHENWWYLATTRLRLGPRYRS
jgi:addiction module HigA family antidote